MTRIETTTPVTRRQWLGLTGGALATAAAATSLPSAAWGQAPKRGGTLSLRLWDPPALGPAPADLVQDAHRAHLHP